MSKPKLFVDICKIFLKEVNSTFKPWNMQNVNTILEIYKYGISTIFHIFAFNYSEATLIKMLEETILLYIEYNSQSQEEKNAFLRLTPLDASRFLFKKQLMNIGSKSEHLSDLLQIYLKCNKFLSVISTEARDKDQIWWQETMIDMFIASVNASPSSEIVS
jgi:hypothetical protein